MRFNDLFSLMGQIFKNTNFQKENQGQGRRVYRDRDYYKEWDANRRQGGWDREPQSRDSNEPRQYANTAAVSGRKSGKSEPRFNKYGSSVVVERILIIVAFTNDVFSGFNRERKANIEYDGSEMPNASGIRDQRIQSVILQNRRPRGYWRTSSRKPE